MSRAGHFRYFFNFFNNKNDFYCTFYHINNLFLHQSYLKNPLPVKLTWYEKQKKHLSWKNEKQLKCPALTMTYLHETRHVWLATSRGPRLACASSPRVRHWRKQPPWAGGGSQSWPPGWALASTPSRTECRRTLHIRRTARWPVWGWTWIGQQKKTLCWDTFWIHLTFSSDFRHEEKLVNQVKLALTNI